MINRQRFKLLWAIPVGFLLFFLALTLFSRWMHFPEIKILGNGSSVNFSIDKPDRLFFISSHSPIEPQYDLVMSDLKFSVTDQTGTRLETDTVNRFFYTRESEGKKIFCGSVFEISKSDHLPLVGKIESNIDKFSEMSWAVSTGSFKPVTLTLIASFLLGICIVYPLTQKSPKPTKRSA